MKKEYFGTLKGDPKEILCKFEQIRKETNQEFVKRKKELFKGRE